MLFYFFMFCEFLIMVDFLFVVVFFVVVEIVNNSSLLEFILLVVWNDMCCSELVGIFVMIE